MGNLYTFVIALLFVIIFVPSGLEAKWKIRIQTLEYEEEYEEYEEGETREAKAYGTSSRISGASAPAISVTIGNKIYNYVDDDLDGGIEDVEIGIASVPSSDPFSLPPTSVSITLPGTPVTTAPVTQVPVPGGGGGWNIDRVDGQSDGMYSPSQYTGSNVDMYIIDTGISPHPAFGSRLLSETFIGDYQPGDCNGHGTHVASTAAGDPYGIARGASIISASALGCDGKGSLMSLVSAVGWVYNRIVSKKDRRVVVNMSIQSNANDLIDELVRELTAVGAVVTVAAANYNTDACNYSPAREPQAITVGASTQDDSKLDSSNFGSCVDVFAPGDDILGASPFSQYPVYKRGTSMASPLVAGIAALLLEANPGAAPDWIASEIRRTATPGNGRTCMIKYLGNIVRSISPKVAPTSIPVGWWIPIERLNASLVSFSQKGWSLTFSDKPFPGGLDMFLNTPISCRDLTARWQVLTQVGLTDQNGYVLQSGSFPLAAATVSVSKDGAITVMGKLFTTLPGAKYVSIGASDPASVSFIPVKVDQPGTETPNPTASSSSSSISPSPLQTSPPSVSDAEFNSTLSPVSPLPPDWTPSPTSRAPTPAPTLFVKTRKTQPSQWYGRYGCIEFVGINPGRVFFVWLSRKSTLITRKLVRGEGRTQKIRSPRHLRFSVTWSNLYIGDKKTAVTVPFTGRFRIRCSRGCSFTVTRCTRN